MGFEFAFFTENGKDDEPVIAGCGVIPANIIPLGALQANNAGDSRWLINFAEKMLNESVSKSLGRQVTTQICTIRPVASSVPDLSLGQVVQFDLLDKLVLAHKEFK